MHVGQPHSAARAAGLAPALAAFESGRESERGRLNKRKEPQTGSGPIDCSTRRSNKGLQLFIIKEASLARSVNRRRCKREKGRRVDLRYELDTARCYKLRNKPFHCFMSPLPLGW